MILNGRKIAEDILNNLRNEITLLRERGVVPGLGIVLIGSDPASVLYVSIKKREATRLGMICRIVEFGEDATLNSILGAIDELNADRNIHGIIVQIPIPKRFDRDRVCRRIAIAKDVDCLNPDSLKRLESGERAIIPPVAESVRLLIEKAGASVEGSVVIVIGSGLFARQIVQYCRNLGARVEQMGAFGLQGAPRPLDVDILITAVGTPNSITAAMVHEQMTVIDVGVSKRNSQTVGDVDFERVKDIVKAITPVPGGVGPVTVACLLENVVKAAQSNSLDT